MSGNPLPESCVMIFTTLCTGWILKKRTRKLVFLQHSSKFKIFENWGTNLYIFPPNSRSTAPLRRLFMLQFHRTPMHGALPSICYGWVCISLQRSADRFWDARVRPINLHGFWWISLYAGKLVDNCYGSKGR